MISPQSPPGATARQDTPRQILAAIALGVLGFAATAALLHAAVRDPLHLHADVRSEKLVMLARQQVQGDIFSAVFGSSHVHNGFDPRAFDRGLAGSPLATHTSNLAIMGGSQSEQRVMALEFLRGLQSPAQRHAASQPCLVVLELNAGANFTDDHLVHPRAINIYDWPTTQLITHFVSPDMSLKQRLGRQAYALAAMGLYYTNVGMLSNRIFAPPVDQASLASETGQDRRGFFPLTPAAGVEAGIAAELARQSATPRAVPGIITPGHSQLVSELAAASPVSNLSFAYLLMPKVGDRSIVVDYPDHLTVAGPTGPIVVPIFNLARPDLYPQLYHPELWFDDAHLDEQGADIASTLLAGAIKQWYAAHGEPAPCGSGHGG